MPLFSPAVIRRRSTPSFSIRPVKPKPSISTPMEPTMLRLGDVDAVGADRDVVAAGGADVVDHRVERDFRVLLAQPAHLVVDVPAPAPGCRPGS